MQSLSLAPSSSAACQRGDASVRNLPVNLFASVMGVSGLALAWRIAHGSLGAPAVIGEAIGLFAVVLFVLISLAYLVKIATHPRAVHAEFHHPVAGSFFGTVAISLLLLSAVIAPYSAPASRAMWGLGAAAAFVLGFIAVSRLLKGQVDASHALPAWLIPGVGTLDIPVTGGQMPMSWAPELNLLSGAIGGALALLLSALIISRLVHREPLSPVITPSLMILVAPFAVGFLAYINIVGGVDRFAAALFYFGLFIFVVLAPKLFCAGTEFSPAWWAVGFPMAALVNAALKYAEFRNSEPLWVLAVLLLAALNLVLAVLTVQTMRSAFTGKLFR